MAGLRITSISQTWTESGRVVWEVTVGNRVRFPVPDRIGVQLQDMMRAEMGTTNANTCDTGVDNGKEVLNSVGERQLVKSTANGKKTRAPKVVVRLDTTADGVEPQQI